MILITGASSGIGAACARQLARAGTPLILCARRTDKLQQLKKELTAYASQSIHCVELDIKDTQKMISWFRSNEGLLSGLTGLINNAGLAIGFNSIADQEKTTFDDWDSMIDTNIKGLLKVTHLALPYLIKNKGHVINLGSVAGHHVYPKGNVYCATKHAVHALTQALRIDLVGTGVRVTEISPGMVHTEFSDVRFRGDTSRANAVYAGMKPLTAEDIADTIVWSLSRPKHVNIEEIVIYPTDQAAPTLVHRNG